MHDSPSRRSRPPSGNGGPALPFIPIFIGVIVLGLVIGAALSMFAKRNDAQVVARVSSPQPTLAAVTAAPTEKPPPEPTVAAEKPAPAPAAVETVLPTHAPAPKVKRVPPAAATPPAATTLARTAPPVLSAAAARPAATGSTVRHAAATIASAVPAAPVTDAPASADDADSDFAKLAAGVVRQYLAAVSRGDVTGAYGALGQSVPDNDATLPEMGIVDGNTRIRHVEARGSSEAAAVNVDMQGRGGLFFGQFTVHRTPSGAAVIVQHTVVKP